MEGPEERGRDEKICPSFRRGKGKSRVLLGKGQSAAVSLVLVKAAERGNSLEESQKNEEKREIQSRDLTRKKGKKRCPSSKETGKARKNVRRLLAKEL